MKLFAPPKINSDESTSVLILIGAGQAFSAGGNVKHLRQREGTFGGSVYAVQQKYRAGIQRVALALHKLELPSIAALNGAAIGAGFDLAVPVRPAHRCGCRQDGQNLRQPWDHPGR